MDTSQNQHHNTPQLAHLRKGAIALCVLLILAGAIVSAALARPLTPSHASTNVDTSALLRLKSVSSLGGRGPGGIVMPSVHDG